MQKQKPDIFPKARAGIVVRLAEIADIVALPDIERSAGEAFRVTEHWSTDDNVTEVEAYPHTWVTWGAVSAILGALKRESNATMMVVSTVFVFIVRAKTLIDVEIDACSLGSLSAQRIRAAPKAGFASVFTRVRECEHKKC